MVNATENMTESMPNMMGHFFGEPKKEEEPKECAIIGLLKNQVIELEEELKEAKLKFADVALEKDNWSGKCERETACKVIEGQIFILNKMQRDMENMLSRDACN